MAQRKRKDKRPQTPLGAIKNHAGIVVSLNLKKRTYFGIGKNDDLKLWLDNEHWAAKVPEGLSDEEALQLTRAIHAGIVVVGKKRIPAIEKEFEVKASFLSKVKNARVLDDKSKGPFRDLVRAGKAGGFTALEILSECLQWEKANRGRQEWILFLQAGIDSYDGPLQLVEDFPDDEDNYDVTISQGIVHSSTKKDDLRIPVTPEGVGTVSEQVAQRELDEFLGE